MKPFFGFRPVTRGQNYWLEGVSPPFFLTEIMQIPKSYNRFAGLAGRFVLSLLFLLIGNCCCFFLTAIYLLFYSRNFPESSLLSRSIP